MPAQLPAVPGKVTLDARKKLTLTGAREVVRFDEDLVELNTDLGTLIIEGQELKLKCLSLDDGTVVVEGRLDGLHYPEQRQRKGLWR